MADSERLQKGRDVRRKLMGEEYVERINRTVYDDPMMQKFIDVASENVFGARTLICVVSDAATGRPEELAIHLQMALRQGWTKDELTEVLIHLLGYVGAPLVREAMLTAKKVFADFT
jgi:4-carboxymuconolactone decarboxylase